MGGFTEWVGSIQQKIDSWARQQRDVASFISPPLPHLLPLPRWQWGWKWQWQWPWKTAQERKEKLDEEYRRRKEQIQSLCHALQAEDVTDLKDILTAMILSESVYKRPESEVVRSINKFSTDFGGQLIQLIHVQPSLDHVPHRYLLAESGDTLFASFIGTKKYKDMITDVNILQRAVFHEDIPEEGVQAEDEMEIISSAQGNDQSILNLGSQSTSMRNKMTKKKPAAHRGFLARARGIPAVELYKLAKKKDRRLVLCGHSLGGAVAVLVTLAILRVVAATSSNSKRDKKLEIKCITFSQPPVGNAALRDYVYEKGWHGHFRTYCIPEDFIPRILSPAYFQHYRMQTQLQESDTDPVVIDQFTHIVDSKLDQNTDANAAESPNHLQLRAIQKSLRRISNLVPLVGRPPKSFDQSPNDLEDKKSSKKCIGTLGDLSTESFKIQDVNAESSLPVSQDLDGGESTPNELEKVSFTSPGDNATNWRQHVPSLPSYVPFGQLFLLEKSSVEPLSASDYTLLTSMQSVLLELKERLRLHSMRSYRSRFQRIYDLCICDGIPPMERVPYLPHFQQWLGLPGVTITELGRIAEPLVLCSATSLIPIGWTGIPVEKKKSSFRVDLCGYGLHLCTLVKAQINGQWYKAIVESAPDPYALPGEFHKVHGKIQKMRISIGKAIQEPSSTIEKVAIAGSIATDKEHQRVSLTSKNISAPFEMRRPEIEDPTEVIVHCSSDFMTVSRKVVMRLRRVRLLGLEGSGKTSLYYALLGEGRGTMFSASDGLFPDLNKREGVAKGVVFVDTAGINLQDLPGEVEQLKQELASDEMNKKIDLFLFVHNLAHKVPRLHHSDKPALSILMDEVISAGIPSILAITNKFAVSADQRRSAAAAVIRTYQMPSDLSVVVNSSPYALHSVVNDRFAITEDKLNIDTVERRIANLNKFVQGATQKLISAPINLIQLPFRRKEVILPIEGVKTLRELVNRVLLDREELALTEFCREQLLLALKNELVESANQMKQENGLSATAIASTIGASLGLLAAVVATANMRKP